MYKALFLPIDKLHTDGCDVVDSSGQHHIWDETRHTDKDKEHLKVAEIFLVDYRFNQIVIVGKPSPEAVWLKNRVDVKAADCALWTYDKTNRRFLFEYSATAHVGSSKPIELVEYFRIKCPTCGVLH